MSSNGELRNAGRGAIEVRYTVHCDHGKDPGGAARFDVAISNAVEHFEKSHLGVHVESRECASGSGDRAVSLLVFGGFDARHLDSIWLHALNLFGLGARRVSVAFDGEVARDIQRGRISAIGGHGGVARGVSTSRTPEVASSSFASTTRY